MMSLDIAGMLDNSKGLDRLRKDQEEVLLEINKMHKKLQSTPELVEKPGDSSLSRLKMLYTQAKDLSESEVTVSSQLLGLIDALLPSGTQQNQRRIEGSEQKKKKVKVDSEVPRMSPSMRSHFESLASLKGEQNGGCDFFSWVDPPTCDRPEKIMPGLVKKMKALERANENFKFENTKLEEKVEKLEEKIEKLQKKVEKLQALNKRLVEKKEKMEMKMGFALAIAALLCVFLLYKIR
ncbi:SGF29 tudor-like domain [Striga asiatica]|uniref:SGF29 tudor-like domain n=1 Tax=Striga asiatica TaxID=4170 RepID=A0A5A7P9H9_STRAF|nr:SGF29 tudor-like domain [Striga asiatica]